MNDPTTATTTSGTGPVHDPADDAAEEHAPGLGLWLGLLAGAPLLAYGVRGALADLPGVQLTSFLRWFVGGAVLHDLLVAPLVCLIGWVVARRLPAWAVAPVQGALIAAGATLVVAYPFVRGEGVTRGEPSFLSRNYTVSVLVLWGLYAAVAAAIAVRNRLRSARP